MTEHERVALAAKARLRDPEWRRRFLADPNDRVLLLAGALDVAATITAARRGLLQPSVTPFTPQPARSGRGTHTLALSPRERIHLCFVGLRRRSLRRPSTASAAERPTARAPRDLPGWRHRTRRRVRRVLPLQAACWPAGTCGSGGGRAGRGRGRAGSGQEDPLLRHAWASSSATPRHPPSEDVALGHVGPRCGAWTRALGCRHRCWREGAAPHLRPPPRRPRRPTLACVRPRRHPQRRPPPRRCRPACLRLPVPVSGCAPPSATPLDSALAQPAPSRPPPPPPRSASHPPPRPAIAAHVVARFLPRHARAAGIVERFTPSVLARSSHHDHTPNPSSIASGHRCPRAARACRFACPSQRACAIGSHLSPLLEKLIARCGGYDIRSFFNERWLLRYEIPSQLPTVHSLVMRRKYVLWRYAIWSVRG